MEHAWWLASRSAGVVALFALTASVVLGLLMANGLLRRAGTKTLLALHESLALAGLVAIGVHGVTLLGDPWMHATLWRISVPGALGYRPLWTGIGVAAGWLALALGLSFYVRNKVGAKLWRKLHRATVLAWAMGVAHTLGAGTDAGELWLQVPVLGGATTIVFLFLRRTVPGDAKRETARLAASRAPTPTEKTAGPAPVLAFPETTITMTRAEEAA